MCFRKNNEPAMQKTDGQNERGQAVLDFMAKLREVREVPNCAWHFLLAGKAKDDLSYIFSRHSLITSPFQHACECGLCTVVYVRSVRDVKDETVTSL